MKFYKCETCGWGGKRSQTTITYNPRNIEVSCPNCNRSVIRALREERIYYAMGLTLLAIAIGLITIMHYEPLGQIGNLVAAFFVFGLLMGSAMFFTGEDGRFVHYRHETIITNRDGTVAKKTITYT